ncbi:uncharacterized protein [Apostichopus japonicus]|uniref:uncharacterized protein isoform X2 n=1 Tax=Stichopus japonicus TaxID=307972 RepID=UPI003AB91453
MAYEIRLICLGVFLIAANCVQQASCVSFHYLQEKLLERSRQNLPADDLVMSEVKDWVSDTLGKLSNKVEFLGNEIEKAAVRQKILEHNQYLDVAENGGQGLTELERESPPYDVLCASENGYEARQYHKALWVITFSDPGEEFLAAKLRCESKIQNYILGHNERGVKIHVTSPWFTKIVASEEGRHRQYIFLFYLPSAFQDDPPTPLDPMIFFNAISPKVYAFSNSYVIGQDAGWSLQKSAITFLNQNQELFLTDQYFLADYEAPFSKYSQNSEILILMEDANLPICDGEVQAVSPAAVSYPDILQSEGSSGDSALISADMFSYEADYRATYHVVQEVTPAVLKEPSIDPYIEVLRSQHYLRKVVNGCSQQSIDETLTELFSCREPTTGGEVVADQPGDILLRVERPTTILEEDHGCGDMRIEFLLRVPDSSDMESLQENMTEGISFYLAPSMVVYATNIPDEGGSLRSLLETSIPVYVNLLERLVTDSLCLADQELYIYGSLASYPTMDKVWIPHENCWNGKRQGDK